MGIRQLDFSEFHDSAGYKITPLGLLHSLRLVTIFWDAMAQDKKVNVLYIALAL